MRSRHNVSIYNSLYAIFKSTKDVLVLAVGADSDIWILDGGGGGGGRWMQ